MYRDWPEISIETCLNWENIVQTKKIQLCEMVHFPWHTTIEANWCEMPFMCYWPGAYFRCWELTSEWWFVLPQDMRQCIITSINIQVDAGVKIIVIPPTAILIAHRAHNLADK